MTEEINFIIEEDLKTFSNIKKGEIISSEIPKRNDLTWLKNDYGLISKFYKKLLFIVEKGEQETQQKIFYFVLVYETKTSLLKKYYSIEYKMYLEDSEIGSVKITLDDIKLIEYITGIIIRHLYIPQVYSTFFKEIEDKKSKLPKGNDPFFNFLYSIPRYKDTNLDIHWPWNGMSGLKTVNKDILLISPRLKVFYEILMWFNDGDESLKKLFGTTSDIKKDKFGDVISDSSGIFDLAFIGFESTEEYKSIIGRIETFFFGRKFIGFFLQFIKEDDDLLWGKLIELLSKKEIGAIPKMGSVVYSIDSFKRNKISYKDFKKFFIGDYNEDAIKVLLENNIKDETDRNNLFTIYKNNKR